MSCKWKSKSWLIALALLAPGAAWGNGEAELAAAQLGTPLPQETLQQRRAGQAGLELNVQETTATLNGNRAIHNVTGDNYIGGGSFAGANGFPVAVQNSGNNVIVQNAFIINLDVR
jgi:hypothetical protein